ncbi:hypothetical protein C0030_004155 [Candidatus Liberibacter solanacearum]|uniref:Transmembrane protein n=1 Tax=Candidatus Liberibacter solanacearum TaxID=556287 RepID=A0A424FLU1_9HYPH|nr:hypothetical protein [Candidatus Liberibacter solanacearum]RPD37130.1 hypothetical protein C0030_004155 [Candidatus Liberibacter solanacearum]
MFRSIALGLGMLFMFAGSPAFAAKIGYCHGYGKTQVVGCKDIHVKGYCKRNGTCVKDYYRCSPGRY